MNVERADILGRVCAVRSIFLSSRDASPRRATPRPRVVRDRGSGTHSMETERAPVALAAFLARASPAAMPACRSMTPLTRDSKWLHQTGVTRMHQSRCMAVDLAAW